MISMLRTILSVKELRLYSACTRFGANLDRISSGFMNPDYTLKLSFLHTVTRNKFKITPYNLYSIVHNLEIAVRWYYDESKKTLFYTEDGILNFNYDYEYLYVNATSPDGNHIEIRPTVDYSKSERGSEGAVIYINDTASQTIMSRCDLEAIYMTLKTFSFQAEALLLLSEMDKQIKEYKEKGGIINETDNSEYQLYL